MLIGKEEITVKGKHIIVDAIEIDNKKIVITGKLIKVARIKDEWFGEEVGNPESLITELKDSKFKADLFTFVQRLPEKEPKYKYNMEWVSVAAMSVKSFTDWWENQIPKNVRKNIRKAERKGIIVREVDFNDKFAEGITEIYNEWPVRQGKPFLHYGKVFDTVRMEAATYLEKSDFIGAYYGDELIGFVKLVYVGKCASTMHVISKIKHRDKAPTSALLSKVVEICDKKELPYLSYGEWIEGTLGDFKRENGFEKVDLPRYYVPLTIKGRIILKSNLHHGLATVLPDRVVAFLKGLRKRWYDKKADLAKAPLGKTDMVEDAR